MLTPWMPEAEIALMDTIFALKRPAFVLEYGAGGSTVRWSGLACVERWLTIEHDPEWAQRASEQAPWADIHLRDLEPATGYVMAPLMDAPFDLIFVDGRHRVECVRASRQFLAPHGVVILHDVWQNDHKQAQGVYPHEMITGCPDRRHNGFLLMWKAEE